MELNHVLTKAAWEMACRAGAHAPPELARDGFLHCCRPEQLAFVLNRHFPGAKDLLVLTFESDALLGALQWVKSEADQAPFPHLYAAIPCSAVLSADPVLADAVSADPVLADPGPQPGPSGDLVS